jgi:flagella basal body P-ring formation protein FlgA
MSGSGSRIGVVRGLVAAVLLCGISAGAGAAEAGWINHENDAPVRAAIIEAVHARMGASVDVAIGELTIRATGGVRLVAPLTAVPDAGARTGGFVRFVIYDSKQATPRRVAAADAEIFAVTEQVQTRHVIARSKLITAEDVEIIRDDVGRVALRPIPSGGVVIGARALRPIAAGDRVAFAMISSPALVKSGDEVQTVVRVGSLEARGTAVAAQTGALGAEIRVVNRDTRRSLRARVIGAREVEVVP